MSTATDTCALPKATVPTRLGGREVHGWEQLGRDRDPRGRWHKGLGAGEYSEDRGHDDHYDRGELVHRAHGSRGVRTGTGSSQALHGHGTRGDTIYEDPASDWLGELDGQVVPYPGSAQRTPGGMTRVSATNTTTMASPERHAPGKYRHNLRPNLTADESNGYDATPIPETREPTDTLTPAEARRHAAAGQVRSESASTDAVPFSPRR